MSGFYSLIVFPLFFFFYFFRSPAVAERVLWNRLCPSVFPSVHNFSRNWLISFSSNLAWCLGPIYSCAWQSKIFLKKSPSSKSDQKRPQIRFLGLFKNFKSSVLSKIGVKRRFLLFINILQKRHAWEKSGSQVMAKNGSRPVRFKYSLVINISLTGWYLTLIFGT